MYQDSILLKSTNGSKDYQTEYKKKLEKRRSKMKKIKIQKQRGAVVLGERREEREGKRKKKIK